MSSGVGQSIKKVDSMDLVTGKAVYTEDLCPEDALVIKLLRSPHAHAIIKNVDKNIALKVAGIVAIYSYEDVPNIRHTLAGQSYPEPSPYDRLILEKRVRYVGDEVCIVAGESEKAVDKAMQLIKVEYEVLDYIIDFEEALDNDIIIHPEDDYHVNFPIGNQVLKNLCASGSEGAGDVSKELENSDIVLERTYYTKANNQGMMEPFKTYCYMKDERLVVVTSTQIPFHVRRHTARALGLKEEEIQVLKPRIGGGFGAKQTMVSELFSAFVTLKTGRASRLYYTRNEVMEASNSRHQMRIKVKIGAKKDGTILAIKMHTLSNTGAYGEHGPTTVGLSAWKTISIYNKAKAYKFDYDVVYTNTMSAGAFRGYGATQGCFAVESLVNELANKLDIDPIELRRKNMLSVGEKIKAYHNELLQSCALEECIETGKKMIDWDNKFPSYRTENGKLRALGMAVTMQGSSISNIDKAAARVVLQKDGKYKLMIGATDMGTGCDTILAQMLATSMNTSMSNIFTDNVDTDKSPYDTGSYASSTTYLTGMSVAKACNELKDKILSLASEKLKEAKDSLKLEEDRVVGINEIALKSLIDEEISGYAESTSPVSPPPFVAGFVEIEVDESTYDFKVVDYVGVVDCGTAINPNLARVQLEGGIVQGIGMAMIEDINFNKLGKMINNSFMRYKIPSRLDIGKVRTAFESSYEPTSPYGAKSIGEVVINTPAPAIAAAVYNAFAVNVRSLPITGEKIFNQKERFYP